MTVVLSVVCHDGVVLGADTQITDTDRGMSYPGQKLHAMGEHAAWGGSGARVEGRARRGDQSVGPHPRGGAVAAIGS